MAEKLGKGGATGATVHQLPTAAAPPAGEKPPKAAKPPKDPGPADGTPGHNSGEDPAALAAAQERKVREALQEKIIGLSSKHRESDNRIAAIKAQLDEEMGDRKEIRAAIGRCVRLDLFDESYDEMRLRTPRIDLEDKERQRDLIREAFGLPRGVDRQGDMLKGVGAPKTAADWESDGYRAGINGEDAADGLKEVPAENHQDFLRGYEFAMHRNISGIKQLEAEIPPSPTAPPNPLSDAVANAGDGAGEGDEDEKQPGDDEVEAVRGRMAGAGSELMD